MSGSVFVCGLEKICKPCCGDITCGGYVCIGAGNGTEDGYETVKGVEVRL